MQKPRIVPVQNDFSRGMVSDTPKQSIPPNGMYDCINMIPNLGGVPLRRRAPWSYYSDQTISGASYVVGGVDAPYTTGNVVLAVDDTGKIQKIVAASPAVYESQTVGTQYQNPVYFQDKVYFPNYGTDIKARDNTGSYVAITDLSSKYAVGHGDRLFAGNLLASSIRVAVSAAGSPSTWDLTNNIYNFERPVAGLAKVHNGVLVFLDNATYILRGSSPGADGDINQELLFPVGIADAYSVAYWNEYALWTDGLGVYLTDGGTLVDLVKEGGVKEAFRNSLASNTSRWAGTVIGDYYLLTSWLGVQAEQRTWLCHIPTRTWVRFTGYKFRCYFGSYAGAGAVGKVAVIAPFDVASNGQDGDSSNVAWSVTTRYFRPTPGKVRFRNAYVSYGLRGTGGSASAGWATDMSSEPEASNFLHSTTLPITFAGTQTTDAGAGFDRMPMPLRTQAEGMMFKISSSGASGMHEADLYGIDLEYWPLDLHR